MSQIGSLQDYRQQGSPADMGTYYFPSSSIVFQFTWQGTTYTIALRAGVSGWTLVSQGVDAYTVIQTVITELGNNSVHYFFPYQYVLSAALTLAARMGVKLLGGHYTSPGSGFRPEFYVNGDYNGIIMGSYCHVQGFLIRGTDAPNNARVYAVLMSFCTLIDVYIHGGKRCLQTDGGGDGWYLQHVTFDTPSVDVACLWRCNDSVFVNCIAGTAPDATVFIQNGDDNTLIGCIFSTSATAAALWIAGTANYNVVIGGRMGDPTSPRGVWLSETAAYNSLFGVHIVGIVGVRIQEVGGGYPTHNRFFACPITGGVVTVGAVGTDNDNIFVYCPGFNLTIPIVLAIGASPYTYQNVSYLREDVITQGGTVSTIEFSRDGATWYNVGFTSGVVPLEMGDSMRVTYTVAPNITRVPQ